MSQRVTFCVLSTASSASNVAGCVKKLINDVPSSEMELRLGLSGSGRDLHELIGIHCPDGLVPDHRRLPKNVDRYHWHTANDIPILAWTTPMEVQLREVLHDVPITTEYVALTVDHLRLDKGWWQELVTLFDQGADYLGEPEWFEYRSAHLDIIQNFGWFMGVPFARRESRPGVSFMKPGMIVVKAEGVCQASFPDSCQWSKGNFADSCNEYVLLGEMARQLGWTTKAYSPQAAGEPLETK